MQQVIGRVGFVIVGRAQKCGYVLYNMLRMTNPVPDSDCTSICNAEIDLIDARFGVYCT